MGLSEDVLPSIVLGPSGEIVRGKLDKLLNRCGLWQGCRNWYHPQPCPSGLSQTRIACESDLQAAKS